MKKIFFLLILLLTSCLRLTVTSGDVANKITGLNRNIDQVKADLRIKKEIEDSIESVKKDFMISNNIRYFGYYEVNVVEGRVLLTGNVYDNNIKSFIVSKVKEHIKVREILDELHISNLDRHTAKDFFLKRSIKTKIFFGTQVRSMNYEFSVINGYVYIIGIADTEDEIDVLTKAISTVQGVKEVISYVITINSDKKIKFNY